MNEITPKELAITEGVTERTVINWIKRGLVPARRVGGRWRVIKSEKSEISQNVSCVAG